MGRVPTSTILIASESVGVPTERVEESESSVDGVPPPVPPGRVLEAAYGRFVHIENAALIVRDYDDAIRFFVDALGFELVEDSPATTNDGRPKRWVVVRPPHAQTGLLLAQADGEHQSHMVGDQYAGRVGLFLRVDDFEKVRERMLDHDVVFVSEPRVEEYGEVAVFLDVEGNRWDLLGPPSR